jgi:hypothetical protein
MHFHDTLVQKLVEIYSTHGGFKDEARLRSVLKDVRVDAVRSQDGGVTLVFSGDNARGPR